MQQAQAQIGTEDSFDPFDGVGPGELHDVLAKRLPSLQRSAYRLLGNAAEAEDAVQDALLSACKHLDQFRGESQISTWLTAIVFNSARMRLRRRRRQVLVSLDERTGEEQQHSIAERLPSRGPNPEEEYRNYELTGHLQRSITQLSPTLLRTYGSAQQSVRACILRGFLKSYEFGLGGCQSLCLQQKIVHVSITAAAAEQSFDVAVDRFHHTHRYPRPAIVQDALEMIQ